jgi:hypothetical protein
MLRRFCVVSPLLLAAALLGFTAPRASAAYLFDVNTYYSFPGCDDYGHCADPDSGYFTVTNNGTSTFTGTVGVVAVGGCAYGPYGPDESESVPGVTLGPGASILIVLNGDSSNNCGFNGTNGAQIFLTGAVTDTAGCVQNVDLRVYDKDIHSGVFNENPCGETTDAYVLQGGSPSGCDTGDDYEVSQAPGHYSFVSTTYAFSGFLQPIDSDGSSIFKLGSTVPVKFKLSPNPGTAVTATLSFAKLTGDILGDEMEATSTAAATTGNLFRYDATSGQYIFNWGTKGLTAGTYQLKVTLDNCQTFTIQVSLKK